MPGSINDTVTLHNNLKMPRLGFGTYKIPDGPIVEQSVQWAIELGYRHVDTAQFYANERGVGNAIRAGAVPREQVFVTSKVWNGVQRAGYDAVRKEFDDALNRFGFDYLDLYLIHWPVAGKYKETWRALEKIHADGRVKSIGVSNFLVHHLRDLMADANVAPMANQIELHPRLFPRDVVDFCQQNHIVVQAWSPLMQGKVMEIPELKRLAEKYGKTVSQIILRWNLQHDIVTIPKSTHRERIAENAQLYDFELSSADMATIDGLNRNDRVGPHPDRVTF